MIFNATYIFSKKIKQTFENTEGAIKSGQSRETGNIGYTRRRQTKQKHNTKCVGHHYAQTSTNNVNNKPVLVLEKCYMESRYKLSSALR
jgi:hypothetical protein